MPTEQASSTTPTAELLGTKICHAPEKQLSEHEFFANRANEIQNEIERKALQSSHPELLKMISSDQTFNHYIAKIDIALPSEIIKPEPAQPYTPARAKLNNIRENGRKAAVFDMAL